MREGKRLSVVLRARKAARRHLDTCEVASPEPEPGGPEVLLCSDCVAALELLELSDAVVMEAGLSATRGTTVSSS